MKQQLQQLQDLLERAREAFARVVPQDVESIAGCGALVEEAAVQLPGGLPYLPGLLNLTLEVLQRVYEGESSSPEDELGAARVALDEAAAWLASDAGKETAALQEAGQTLWLLLGREPGMSPFIPSDLTVVAAEAPPPAPVAAQGEATLGPSDLMALIIGLQPDDQKDLEQIERTLQALAAGCQPVTDELAQALQAIREVIATPSDEALAAAVSALSQIVEDDPEEEALRPVPVAAPLPPKPEESTEAKADEAKAEDELLCLGFSGDPALLGEFVTESLDHLQTAEVALLDLEGDPSNKESINAVFRGFHTIKGTAGFLGLPHIQKLAHHAEALLDRARNDEFLITGPYAELTLQSADMLRVMITALQQMEGDQLPPPPAEMATLLANLKAPESYSEQGVATVPAAVAAAPRPVAEGSAEAASDSKQKAVGDSTVRVRTDRLDALINLVGELVIANAMLVQDEVVRDRQAAVLGRKVSQVNKITRELQAVGTSMRMVPLKNTFQKMARVVRDVGHKSGKPVRFISEGEDTEIDRSIVEALGDPLLHMIRNAVDHGLETPEGRAQAGKDQTGTVTLRAYHAAGSVVIELRDDGRGLDRNRILAKAVAAGLVEEGRELTDADIYRLIFAPGLSTADKVTDVSGRGVGMDVVARNIEALRGRVDIASTPGEGSVFSIHIPLTLAIMDGMLVRVGSERYLIPTTSIQQAFRATGEDLSTIAAQGEVVMFRDSLIPIVRLHRIFHLEGAISDPQQALLVVTEEEQGGFALMVDELLGQQQIVIKSLGNGLRQIPGISGSAILGDGRVGLILDLQAIARLVSSGAPAAAA